MISHQIGFPGGFPPTTPEIDLSPAHAFPLFCLKNIDFVISMVFLAILPNLCPNSRNLMGNLAVSLLCVASLICSELLP